MSNFVEKFKKSDIADKLTLIIALILLVLLFSLLNPNYFSVSNLTNVLIACSLTGFVAIGETNLIIANQNDLSAGSVAAFAGVLAAVLCKAGLHPYLAMLTAVLSGAAVGCVNATLVTRLKLQPFIATLASMSIVRGFAYILCNGKAVAVSSKPFVKLGTTRLMGWLPVPVLLLLIAYIVFGLILSKTYFGRSVYVLGGNTYAAKLAGLNPTAIIYRLHITESSLAAFAGVLLAARMNSGQPSACEGLEFDAITAAVLGGTAFTGGVGTIFGTFLGMVVLQGFKTGLNMVGVQTFWQQVAQGALLIVALAFDYLRKIQREKRYLEESMAARGITNPAKH